MTPTPPDKPRKAPKSSDAPRPGVDTMRVGKLEAAPGTCVRGRIPIARLPTQGWLELPVAIFNGAQPGPCIWVSGAVHGDELNGVEIIRELAAQIKPSRLSGAVLAVPVVNVFGFAAGSRYTPDRRDLNRSFPGSQRGSLASRLAALFMREIVSRCELGLDLHTAAVGRVNEPQVRCDGEDKKLRAIATAFGAPVIYTAPAKGTLRGAAAKRGAKVLLYEAGGPNRFDDEAIRVGLRGVKRVMKHLGMYNWGIPAASQPASVYKQSQWVRAPCSGLFLAKARLGSTVAKGDVVGTIGDALGQSSIDVVARTSGRVIGATTQPLAHQGDALLHVASLK